MPKSKAVIQTFKVGRHRTTIHRKVRQYVKAGYGSVAYTSVALIGELAGEREAELVVEIDFESLVNWLKRKAMRSNGRRASLLGGAVILRVVKETEKDTIIPHVHRTGCYDKDGQLACGCEAATKGKP